MTFNTKMPHSSSGKYTKCLAIKLCTTHDHYSPRLAHFQLQMLLLVRKTFLLLIVPTMSLSSQRPKVARKLNCIPAKTGRGILSG